MTLTEVNDLVTEKAWQRMLFLETSESPEFMTLFSEMSWGTMTTKEEMQACLNLTFSDVLMLWGHYNEVTCYELRRKFNAQTETE